MDAVRVETGVGLTSWGAADDDAAYAFVDACEPAGASKALGRLQSGLDRVDGEEEQVDGCSCEPACLSTKREYLRQRKEDNALPRGIE